MAKNHQSKQRNLKRIAITGPESTGKSRLSEQLAAHYDTFWVREFAREYLAQIDRPYVFDDIKEIAKGQYIEENKVVRKALIQNKNLIFCDTDFLVLHIWCMKKYGKCDPYIETKLTEHRYDLYLLCDKDLPWEFDPLRENPDERELLFSMYKSVLEELQLPYKVVTGKGEQRLMNAVEFVDNC